MSLMDRVFQKSMDTTDGELQTGLGTSWLRSLFARRRFSSLSSFSSLAAFSGLSKQQYRKIKWRCGQHISRACLSQGKSRTTSQHNNVTDLDPVYTVTASPVFLLNCEKQKLYFLPVFIEHNNILENADPLLLLSLRFVQRNLPTWTGGGR